MKIFVQLKQFTILLLLLYFATYSQAQGLSVAVGGSNTGSIMTVLSTSVINESCAGAADGQVTIVMAGGTPNYTYSWYDNASITSTRANLIAGDYTVAVTDAAGCTTIQLFTLTVPLPLTATATTSNASVCSGISVDLLATVAGGTSPYTYSWDNGAGSSLTVNVTPLVTTTYIVYVTDAHGCSITASVNVNVLAVPNTGLAAIPLQTCTISATAINLASLLAGEDAGGTWTLQSPTTGVSGFNALTGEFTPLGNSEGTYLFTYSITNAPCPIASSSVSVVLDNMNCPIRPTLGDFASTLNCQTFSGNSWIDVFDGTGNLVFSINPNGNNLGPTCWGVRVENNLAPRNIVSNLTNTLDSVFYVDRNIYINPTNQPDPNIPVSIRLYVLDEEIQRFTAALNITNSQIGITRFSGSSISSVDLDPTNDYTTQASQAAYLTQNTFSFGNNWRFDFETNHFSEFNPGYSAGAGVFPVTVVSFKGEQKENYHQLDWVTSYELNMDGFEIEHSKDGLGYKKIGAQAALGVVGGGHAYTFTNETPNVGDNYYRLKLTDKNGISDYSKIIVLAYSPALSVFVFPNPVKDRLTFDIQGTSVKKQMVKIEIFNIFGQLMVMKEIELSGNAKEEFNVDSLSNGVYNYVVTIGKQVLKGKIVKQ